MKHSNLEHRRPCQEQPQSGEAQALHPPGLLGMPWPPILCTPALFYPCHRDAAQTVVRCM